MKPAGNQDIHKEYETIFPNSKTWPIRRLSRRRKEFIEQVTLDTFHKLKKNPILLRDRLEGIVHREKIRIEQNSWKVDPEDDRLFWMGIRSRLVGLSQESIEDSREIEEDLLYRIVSRYVNEIAGSFRPSYYRAGKQMAAFGFRRLLNASRVQGIRSLWSNRYSLRDKLHIVGAVEHVRKLATLGTVVFVPTHYSNLDSILVGWSIDTIGVPPVTYGAGLNLFNIKLFSYFMNSLGAYKVDRRKKNLAYLESLKNYSSLSLQEGCHSLFFPGGTRSRSGKIEKRLKLGLLGTALDAQRSLFEKYPEGSSKKVFIVPIALNYHFVLEAPELINQYLQQKGQERYYVEKEEYSNSYKILKFLFKFFTKGSDISVSFGRGLDLFGNYVDDEGNSIDNRGRKINTRDYFTSDGRITHNPQREEEYTRMLSEVVVREFHRISRVFSSHLVAFVAFELLKKQHYNLDLYDLLRLPEEERLLPYGLFRKSCSKLREKILQLNETGMVGVAPHLLGDMDEVIQHGLENVGMYHAKRPVVRVGEGISSEDMNTLFYYHNRLEGYGLEKEV
ncbi:1-acyl-sn-glycerol-3-phosphate acyltransferase [Xanthovirga aplysinae]|uniref:1-acyl-sn-glycerol-3-phosphate acyltransferase n=1 Tax=Xanthovirga aplysinae TaxID=2529853 RepID=UPI0012BC55B8|nr:1-acyl-sn-glycerol-3-phosphate acyltransferase [Xanthovirga aplysinae]MTI31101.1 glycerol-3-phosphate acyltransferase [Xanthovirga aplysinae]